MDLTKGMPAKIHVETKITDPNGVEKFVFDEKGKVVQMGSSYYIRYEESVEGSDGIPVTFKVEPTGIVTLTRRGDVKTRLRFELGKSCETLYRLPQGSVYIDTVTNHLEISYTDEPFTGHVQIQYALYYGKEKLGDYHLQLIFTV